MAKLIPHCSSDCVDVIVRLLAYDPDDRLSARQAVKHPYFKDLRAAELKEKQAAAAHASGESEGPADERTHAPASTTNRNKKTLAATVGGMSAHVAAHPTSHGGGHGDGGGGGGMLPSIDKSREHREQHRSHKHSKQSTELAAPSDVGDHSAAPQQACTALIVRPRVSASPWAMLYVRPSHRVSNA